ncbi:MAG TPA: SpoIID/LytB domain-containing protein [Smithellaceae bacterium]|nr:SpoIID/LytB domain-containing protein [Smithellaceae bacterium]
MIKSEPKIKVAILQKSPEAALVLHGVYCLAGGRTASGSFTARAGGGGMTLLNDAGQIIARGNELTLTPDDPSKNFFTLQNVRIGIDFHWDRLQTLSFRGGLMIKINDDETFSLLNLIGLEDYLASVISSEMSAEAPLEFLKAQAITARSWLVAMLEKKKSPRAAQLRTDDEIAVWQDVNDHEGFDVCADDHCQRYQGITKIISENVARAIDATSGEFLVSGDRICDARYYKCCGGRTEEFRSAWEDVSYPYLSSIADAAEIHPPIASEEDATLWLDSHPAAYCNTSDKDILKRILPAFDLETLHFYRWRVEYEKEELRQILLKKSGIDFGNLQHFLPVERGPSGRISKLKIIGSKRTVVVGKELEIRRWLSDTHLLSSAFIVAVEHDPAGNIKRFIFHGGGWGHGVGLCQIGAAVMATQGFQAREILAHYFTGAAIQKLY